MMRIAFGVMVTLLGWAPLAAALAPTPDLYAVASVRGSTVTIDLGTKEKPGVQNLGSVTIIDRAGATLGKLLRVVEACESICEEKECHYTAEYTVKAGRKITLPAGAVTGAHVVAKVRVPRPVASKESAGAWLERLAKVTGKPVTVWADRKASLAKECKVAKVDAFATLLCSDTQGCSEGRLYSAHTQILASEPGCYGDARLDVISAFVLDGQPAYLVLVGDKAAAGLALLLKSGAEWQVLRFAINYATIC